ncbi:MAG: VWA domain-containing protein [Pseudomonadota bacterium]
MNILKPVDEDFEPETGKLGENVTYFGRALRKAGVPVGPAQVLEAIEALKAAGLRDKPDFYWILHSIFVKRRDHSPVFADAFELFWRKRGLIDKMMAMLMPSHVETDQTDKASAKRRASDAMFDGIKPSEKPKKRPKLDIDASFTASDKEVLRARDFEQMTATEVERAKAEIAKLRLVFRREKTRRFQPTARRGLVDPRRTMKASIRGGGGAITLKYRENKQLVPPIVALCDISGSMSQYSRLFLHFLHALTNDQHRVHAFVFGTQLTNISRHMRHRDVDDALEACGQAVGDWSGGTRISSSIEAFNKTWSRRVLTGGAIMLLITDGLERDDASHLEKQMERLQKSCRRLIWLNPLLRYDAFEPKAQGIRAILPHVDEFRPIHTVNAMADLVEALASPPQAGHAALRVA